MLALYGAGGTLLDSPGSFFEVMALSPQSAGTPGSSPGGSSPFSKIAVRNIWLLKDKQAVVEDYEHQGEPSLTGFCADVYIVRHEAIESRRNTKGADPDLADSVYIKGKIIIALK